MKDMKSINYFLEIISEGIQQLGLNEKFPAGLYQPAQYTLNLGGKRIRPALTLMACDLFCENPEKAIKPALGIEVFHNFTLLHDDIMDQAVLRRGQETVHRKWNQNTAILSGDVMQIIAYQLVAEAPEDKLKEVLTLFSQTAMEICEGQQLDMEFEHRADVEPEEYIEMIRLKTAVLLGCALKTGAIIGGADEESADKLYSFGINTGLAFQLKDDLLDVYGDETVFGKKIGGDILSNKHTYLLIHAKKRAGNQTKEALQYWLSCSNFNPEEKIRAVTGIYNQLDVKKVCEDTMNQYFGKALEDLTNLRIEEEKKHELRKLAEKLMFRND